MTTTSPRPSEGATIQQERSVHIKQCTILNPGSLELEGKLITGVSHEPFLKLIKQAAPLQRGALFPKQEPGGEDKGEGVVDMEQTKVTSSLQNYLEFLEERLRSVLGNDKSEMAK